MTKLKFFIFFSCFFFFAGIVFAQSEPAASPPASEINQMVQEDENIKSQDPGMGDPTILPDNPLYAFKNMSRGVQSFFTFNPIKKAELKLQFSNEKLLEAQKLAKQDKKPEILNQALENYKTETEKLKKETQNIKETAKENEKVDKFLDKFVDQSIKQQKLLGKLEKELSSDSYMALKNAKEGSLQQFSDVALKMTSSENLQEKLTKTLDQQTGSQFKNFKNLEVLKEIEDKVPEQAKNAIQMAQENSFKKLQGDLEQMSTGNREKFNDYVKNIGGNEVRHMEIIHQFEAREIPKTIREELEKAKERAFERIDKKMQGMGADKQKEEFLRPLGSGQMEGLRIINELENNLPPETIDKILEIKNQAMKNFKEGVEKADTPEKMDELLKRAGEFHDVKQFAMLEEMDNVIPEDKKELWNKMKDTVMQEMKIDIALAQNMEERKMKFEKLAGDMPQGVEIIKEFGLPPTTTMEILKEQVNKLASKIENTEDAAKLQSLRQAMEQEETIKKELENRNPEIFKKIDVRQEIFQGETTKEKAVEQIEKAKQEIVAAENEFSGLDDKTKNEIAQRSPYRILLTNAQKKINVAQTAIENELFGEAFGMATAALHESNNARRIIKEIGLRREMFEKQDTERKAFEEKFFNQADGKREILETRFEREFKNEQIPLPGEFRIEFLPEDQILQPMMPSAGEPMQAGEQTPATGGCACIQVWDPVCGKDGRTYGNACEAKCANIEITSKGSCGGEQRPSPIIPGQPDGMTPPRMPEFMECASDLSCPQPKCAEGTICPRFKCIDGKCLMEEENFQKPADLPCAKTGEKINRNPLLGPTSQRCCKGLMEIFVSKSYSICEKEIKREEPQQLQPGTQPQTEEQPPVGLPNPASVFCQKMGYKLEIRTEASGGQYGVCIFPDKNECEEWKFFRGECGTQYKKGGAIPAESTPAPRTEEKQINRPIEPGEIGGCAQVITYRKEGDKCFVCPDACSLIEKCKEAERKECQNMQNIPQNEMKTPQSQNESPFQFFKDTIRDLIRPEENKEQMPMEKPNEQMKNPDIQSDKQFPIMPNKDLNPEMQINKPQPLNIPQNQPIMRPDQQPQNQPIQQPNQQPMQIQQSNQRPIQQLNQQPMNQPMQQPNQQPTQQTPPKTGF